jgi:hypothetical protein
MKKRDERIAFVKRLQAKRMKEFEDRDEEYSVPLWLIKWSTTFNKGEDGE